MREVAVLGLGMHPWGKFPDKSVTKMCREAVEAALADAPVDWREIEAVSAASSRFSGGKGWGLNGNDVVEEMGSTGIPIYNLSARSEEHTSELQSLFAISYAVFCLDRKSVV